MVLLARYADKVFTDTLTHEMVHRTHMEIFNYYYPPVFENWWTDVWIALIYKPNRSVELETWEVLHSLKYGSRYTADLSIEKMWEVLVMIGNVVVESNSRQKSSCQTTRIISYCLFRSEPSTVVPTKSDSDVKRCLQLLSTTQTCTLHLS